jgi:hypothetical protein
MMTLEQQTAVVNEALTWLNTPYHASAGLKGIGVDCARSLYNVYRAVGMCDEINIPPGPSRQFIKNADAKYLETVQKYAVEIAKDELTPGCIVMFRMKDLPIFTHGAIVITVDPLVILHAVIKQGVILSSINEGFVRGAVERKYFSLKAAV